MVNRWEELVEISERYKGRGVGKQSRTLRKIATQTGVKLSVENGEVYIVYGTQQQNATRENEYRNNCGMFKFTN